MYKYGVTLSLYGIPQIYYMLFVGVTIFKFKSRQIEVSVLFTSAMHISQISY